MTGHFGSKFAFLRRKALSATFMQQSAIMVLIYPSGLEIVLYSFFFQYATGKNMNDRISLLGIKYISKGDQIGFDKSCTPKNTNCSKR